MKIILVGLGLLVLGALTKNASVMTLGFLLGAGGTFFAVVKTAEKVDLFDKLKRFIS